MNDNPAPKARVLQDNRSKHNISSSRYTEYANDTKNSRESTKQMKRQTEIKKPSTIRKVKAPSTLSKTNRSEKLAETKKLGQAEGVNISQQDIDDWMNMFSGPSLLVRKDGSAYAGEQLHSPGNNIRSSRRRSNGGRKGRKSQQDIDLEQLYRPEISHQNQKQEPTKSKARGKYHKNHRDQKDRRRKPLSKTRHFFPFLSLPRELRDMIYEDAIDLSGIATNIKNEGLGYFDGMRFIDSKRETYKMVELMMRLKDRHGQMKTPTVLLVNRQIHLEALSVLYKRSITFNAPAINSPNVFAFAEMVSPELIRSVTSIELQIPMKYHTDATMAGELQIGGNWFSHSSLDNESLDSSQCWAYFLLDLIAALWTSGRRIQRMTISIVKKAGTTRYVLKPNQTTLSGLDKTIQGCIKSRNLEHFLGYLRYAEIPEMT